MKEPGPTLNLCSSQDFQILGSEIRVLPAFARVRGLSISRLVNDVPVDIGGDGFSDLKYSSKLWKQRANSNSPSFVMLNFGLRNVDKAIFEVDV